MKDPINNECTNIFIIGRSLIQLFYNIKHIEEHFSNEHQIFLQHHGHVNQEQSRRFYERPAETGQDDWQNAATKHRTNLNYFIND